MVIKRISHFKDQISDSAYFNNWIDKLQKLNRTNYDSMIVKTSLGKTQIYGIRTDQLNLEPLLIFPGARTSALFWELDHNLKHISEKFRIYLIETNGLPNLSDGSTPDIKGTSYGEWAAEVMKELNIEKAFVAGASFGGLVCMKLAMVAPEKIKAAFLFNPGCLQFFSMKWKNLYANLKPIFRSSPKNVSYFLDTAVLYKPNHTLSAEAEQLLIDYEVFAIKRYKDRTQKPYFMGEELKQCKVPVFLVEGDKDLLFPYEKSIENAKKLLPDLREIKVFKNVGHGIELYPDAISYMNEKLTELCRHA
jgi:pimeloyl-ACP methyl ester carboxylesterase